MRKGWKIVAGFAVVGFVLPWLLLVFYGVAHHAGFLPSPKALLVLCPTSIISLGLDNASVPVALLGWTFISLSNAALYAVPGVVVAAFVAMWTARD